MRNPRALLQRTLYASLKLDARDHELRKLMIPALGYVVEGQAEGLGLARLQPAHARADDGHPLAQHQLAVWIVERAEDLARVGRAVTGIADLALDFDDRLLQVAFVRLDLDAAQLQ